MNFRFENNNVDKKGEATVEKQTKYSGQRSVR